MGKLTKAERDTLVKRIQDQKISTVMWGIGAVFVLYCWFCQVLYR